MNKEGHQIQIERMIEEESKAVKVPLEALQAKYMGMLNPEQLKAWAAKVAAGMEMRLDNPKPFLPEWNHLTKVIKK